MIAATSTPVQQTTVSAEKDSVDGDYTSQVEYSSDFPLPSWWTDKSRVDALLSSFRNRDVNPEHYDSKMKFWQDIILQYCVHKGSACFHKSELQKVFTSGQKVPYGLDTVFSAMLLSKQIRNRIEYEYDPLNTWTGWAANSFIKRPVYLFVNKLKSKLGWQTQESLGLVEYVHLFVLKKFCNELESKVLQQQRGEVLHYEAFKALVKASMKLQEDCLYLCLYTLNAHGKIGLEYRVEGNERHLHLIKIPSKADGNIAITDFDHNVHNLKMTQASLVKQLENMEESIEEYDVKARQCIQENKRNIAKVYLRKKMLLEKNHVKRSAALHNIESLLVNVDEAQANGEIMGAYKIGSKALQQVLNESGLKYDNVNEIIAEMRTTMDVHQEVQDSLSFRMASDDDADVEHELEEILGELSTTPKDTKKEDEVKTAVANNEEAATTSKITDADLWAMLEKLEMEDSTPRKSSTSRKELLN